MLYISQFGMHIAAYLPCLANACASMSPPPTPSLTLTLNNKPLPRFLKQKIQINCCRLL